MSKNFMATEVKMFLMTPKLPQNLLNLPIDIIVQILMAEIALRSRISFFVGDVNKYQLRQSEKDTMNF